MNVRSVSRWRIFTASVTLGAAIGLNQCAAAGQPADLGANGVEVQTRGPVHEAFAETISFDAKQGIVAPKAPPAPIDELAPSQRPEGKNLAWIPGYWTWDDERNDFLWISGIWRAMPPGRQWVPGYWASAQQGVQWTSGYWADANATEIQYLPAPPASVEEGPNVAAPSTDATWLPGSWVWQQNQYAWRAGFWAGGNQDWDWVPDHYVWTPRGYVFIDGYYDYSVSRRGVAFAPVFFNADLRSQSGFSYTPSAVINLGVFANHLFLRPSYGHYYFGDYYDSSYAEAGFAPWFSYQSSRRGYDPIYANQRWQHRSDRDWEHRNEANFSNFRDNKDARPPRTWAAQKERAARGDASTPTNNAVTTSLDDLARHKDSGFKFQAMDKNDQKQFSERSQAYRKFQEQRQKLNADAARKPAGDTAGAKDPARTSFARSPFVAPADQLDANNAPPKRHEVLKPDLQAQPLPKTPVGQTAPVKGDRQGAAEDPKPRDPKASLKFDSKVQPKVQEAPRGKSETSNDQPRDRGGRPGQNKSKAKPADAGQTRDASNDKPQDAHESRSKGKKGKD